MRPTGLPLLLSTVVVLALAAPASAQTATYYLELPAPKAGAPLLPAAFSVAQVVDARPSPGSVIA